MCGLAGAFGKDLYKADIPVFEQLLMTASLRGMQSTGMAVWDKGVSQGKTNTIYIKDAVDATSLVYSDPAIKFTGEIVNPYVLMGHTRAATKGSVKRKNAHPFHHGNILLAHNGGISEIPCYKDFRSHEVDSDGVAKAISLYGIERVVYDCEGWYVFTYLDMKEKTFNIVRNFARDIYIAKSSFRGNAWFYASEKGQLEWILDRNRWTHEEPVTLGIHRLMSFNMEDGSITFKDLKKKEIVSHYPSYAANADWGFRDEDDLCPVMIPEETRKQEALAAPPIIDISPKKDNVVDISKGRRPLNGFFGTGKDFLTLYGLQVDDKIKVKLTSFTQYKTNRTMGNGYGTIMPIDSHYGVVQVNGFKPIFKLQKRGDVGAILDDVIATICGACWDEAKQMYTIFANFQNYWTTADANLVYMVPIWTNNHKKPLDYLMEFKAKKIKDAKKAEEPKVLAWGGQLINKETFEYITKDGCPWCQANLYFHKSESLYWIDPITPLCTGCLMGIKGHNETLQKVKEDLKQTGLMGDLDLSDFSYDEDSIKVLLQKAEQGSLIIDLRTEAAKNAIH